MNEKLLTTKQVAEYFGVANETVTQKFIPRGLKYFEVGTKDYRYNKKDVFEFEETQKAKTLSRQEMNNNMNFKLIMPKCKEMKVY